MAEHRLGPDQRPRSSGLAAFPTLTRHVSYPACIATLPDAAIDERIKRAVMNPGMIILVIVIAAGLPIHGDRTKFQGKYSS